jgi:mannosyltransferase
MPNADLEEPGIASESTEAPREIVAIGVVAVAIGVILRFASRSPLWLDEALTVNISALPFGDMLEALRHDGHPPLFYGILHVWMNLFGEGDFAVRALSGVFGLVALPLAWVAGRRRGGPLLGWLTVTMVALSPFAIRYSDEARMYSLVMLLVLAGYLLVDDIIRAGKDSWGRLFGVTVVTAALLYTHYWSLWLLSALGLVLLWTVWKPFSPPARRISLKVVAALVVGGALFIPWLPAMLYQAANTGTPWAAATRPTAALSFTLQDYGSGLYSDAAFVLMVICIAIVLAVLGRTTSNRTIELDFRTRPQVRIEALIAALAFAIGSGVTFLSNSAFATRYTAIIFPLVALLIAAGFTRLTGRVIRFVAVCGFSGFLCMGGLWFAVELRSQAADAARVISEHAGESDLVVYCPDQLGPAANRVLGDDLEQVVYPTFDSPQFVDWVDYANRNANSDPVAFADRVLTEAGPNRAIFVVWNPVYKTFEGQCEKLIATLGSGRPAVDLLVADGDGFYEHESVTWYPVDTAAK